MNTTYQKINDSKSCQPFNPNIKKEKKHGHMHHHQEMDFGFLVFNFVAFLVNFLALFALQLPLLQPLHQEVPKVNIQLLGEDHQDPGQTMNSPKLWKMFGIAG